MVVAKALHLTKLGGARDVLEGWILQLDEYFTVTLVRNE